MKVWKTAALGIVLATAAGVGAAIAPAGHAQSGSVRVVTPRTELFAFGGARLGISVSDVDDADVKGRPAAGVLIDDVNEGSPAEQAGLRKGDVLVEFDGERIRSVRQFTRLVSETPPGRTVPAVVLRDGQRLSITVTPREDRGFRSFEGDTWRRLEELTARRAPARPTPAPAPLPPIIEVWPGRARLGVTTSELSSQLGEYFGTSEGVLVTSVTADSPAARAGLKAGDVITSVNGMAIDSSSDLVRRLQRLDSGGEFTLGVVRDKKSMTLKGKLESSSTRRRTTIL